ncbi:acetyl-CoA carboxylase biotin carboxyl carrier protein [Brevibacillus fulvus]|nr:acetyl-CoA carboxylase biotin carboxyl carrier protein [Brevibacillus fulvus]
MIKVDELKEIIKMLDQSSIHVVELEDRGAKVVIRKADRQPPAGNAVPEQTERLPETTLRQSANAKIPAEQHSPLPNPAAESKRADQQGSLQPIASPMVGTFYSKPEPNEPSFVKPGDKVKPDTIVCIIEAMKLFNEIEAEITGELVEVLVRDGELVEYGQPLFLVKAE